MDQPDRCRESGHSDAAVGSRRPAVAAKPWPRREGDGVAGRLGIAARESNSDGRDVQRSPGRWLLMQPGGQLSDWHDPDAAEQRRCAERGGVVGSQAQHGGDGPVGASAQPLLCLRCFGVAEAAASTVHFYQTIGRIESCDGDYDFRRFRSAPPPGAQRRGRCRRKGAGRHALHGVPVSCGRPPRWLPGVRRQHGGRDIRTRWRRVGLDLPARARSGTDAALRRRVCRPR